MIYGVDVSSYQAERFPLTTPGGKEVDFAIIKATEGLGYANPKLQDQLRHAREHGLSVGFYHFASAGDIRKQADFFMATVIPLLRLGDHLWFDWESADISNAQKDDWIRYVQQKNPEHRVGLYCNRDFWLNRDKTDFAGDALWIADYSVPEGKPKIQADWTIHQFSDSNGIDENVADFASHQDMLKWAGDPVATNPGGNTDAILEALNDLKNRLMAVEALVGKLQSGQNTLPGKVATEINKRLKN